jgi:hypothetical protein
MILSYVLEGLESAANFLNVTKAKYLLRLQLLQLCVHVDSVVKSKSISTDTSYVEMFEGNLTHLI